jgi:D-alanine-D-alanine ligase
MEAFRATGASGWGRVDFIIAEDKTPYLLEINTVPGMTSHSLVPMAAKARGITFEQLVLSILNG